MMWGFGPGGWGFGGIGFIFMAFWWVLIIALVVLGIRWFMRQSQDNQQQTHSALDTLKDRYAKGEIDKREFEEKKKDLTN